MEVCLKEAAPLYKISKTQFASCWLHDKDAPVVKGFVKCESVPDEETEVLL